MKFNLRITLITGNHPRHCNLVQNFIKNGYEIQWFQEIRESFLPTPESNLSVDLSKLFSKHFASRADAEYRFFGSGSVDEIDVGYFRKVEREDLSNDSLVVEIARWQPSLLMSYGCHKIGGAILDLPGIVKWNVHGGLSPSYKGTATHFWPTYLLEPQYTGITLHETTNSIDAGNVVYQHLAEVLPEDGIHENAARMVESFNCALPQLILNVEDVIGTIKGSAQKSSGRLWLDSMWHPGLLAPIYNTFENRINKFVIDNNLINRTPIPINHLNN